ncbi:MAG: hypothetical protein A3B74_04245 [Candidatus Kerfeldbacteria bacterium RIFCSPHIGHO2_02_FULL_42_14]|uniref:Uncharacterized protein n=1 Tax=Candidatus Kerfeldbacteria bacterium RIFCSPHIGHO2_02_FULL_42_14 TaxID=1798540 RepID=A0A1G2APH1_9BACT|nr:MAG: hypothetical protein A3B74_04245 [Candidatus Kerfeldbacteria bacterium RIFCSPHIGHO2_02_FULL_42_14]OGY81189.1 MAG: hypothetical protein A3E60_02775 [Candidatus Kerfeldbacteria bacterium RIFCSPHIGHO2_12_FULL_42_13]OGY83391.1 MAG: hypothetical protein A3I91_01935 [Candidatus Kerfeldbacteria bacterium RIFCSPLOWO2_02_FULL_42_19]OGY85486.1 MAG: hypothetical protein A3G01_03570 [Candidatus Kerfeldbacteria bacterium RIFCSPLOWO2_12_FULL_43_9]
MPEKPKRQIPETESVETDIPPLDEENLAPESEADTTILSKMRSQMKGWETKTRAKNIKLQQEKMQEEVHRQSEIEKVRQEILEEMKQEEKGRKTKREPVSMEEINAESARWRETVNRLEREGKITQESREKKYDPEFEIVKKELEAYEKETENKPLISPSDDIDQASAQWRAAVDRLEKEGRMKPQLQEKSKKNKSNKT